MRDRLVRNFPFELFTFGLINRINGKSKWKKTDVQVRRVCLTSALQN